MSTTRGKTYARNNKLDEGRMAIAYVSHATSFIPGIDLKAGSMWSRNSQGNEQKKNEEGNWREQMMGG